MRPTTSKRQLQCILTDSDRLHYSREIARAVEHKRSAETRLKSAQDQIKSEITSAEEEINRYSTSISNGFETREVECSIQYDFEHGVKTFFRTDTGELVTTETISDRERKEWLDFGNEDGPVPIPEGSKQPEVVEVVPAETFQMPDGSKDEEDPNDDDLDLDK